MTVNTSAHSNRLINMHLHWYETEGEQVRFKSKPTVDHDIKRDLKTFLPSLHRHGVFLQLSFKYTMIAKSPLKTGGMIKLVKLRTYAGVAEVSWKTVYLFPLLAR